MKKKVVTRTKKPSKLEMLTLDTMQTFAHRSSVDINHVQTVVRCQLDVVEVQIVELQASLSKARAERAGISAILLGLGEVVGRR